MDKDESQVEQSGCGCDSSSGDDVCCTPGSGKSNWRTALFIVAVVLAGGVAAHSVLTNGGSATPCGGAGAICAIEQNNGNGGGQACAMTAACALEQSNGNGGEACSKIAACTLEQSNGNGGGQACSIDCPSEKGCCQDAPGEAAGCCPSMAPPAPTPEAEAGCGAKASSGCCPSTDPPAPTPEAEAGCGAKQAPSGCCPGH